MGSAEWSPRLSKATVACHHFAAVGLPVFTAQLRQTTEMTYTGIGISQSGSNNAAFITNLLRTGITRKVVTTPAESHYKSPMMPMLFPKLQRDPRKREREPLVFIDIGRCFCFCLIFLFSFSITRGQVMPSKSSVSSARRRFQRIDCFSSLGGENTLYINERPARPQARLTTRRYLWP